MAEKYSEETVQRFQQKVNKTPGCWLWVGAQNNLGYGQLRVQHKALYAHRMAYEIYKARLQPGEVVRHSCDNPSCVNPEHLLAGTKADNSQDALNRERFGAQRTPGNAKLTWESVREIRKLLATTSHTKQAIAKMFNIGAKTVYHIQVNNQWIDGPGRPGYSPSA